MMGKILGSFLFIFVFVFLITPNDAFASENFSTDYTVDYNIEETGNTRVKFDVKLTNNTSEYYTPSYKISVGFEDVKNVKAFDDGGEITPTLENSQKGTSIELVFNKRVVGLGNSILFTLSFDTNEVAKKQGNIWKLQIPGLSEKNEFGQFQAIISVPKSFGQPSIIKSDFGKGFVDASDNTLQFSKKDIGKSGITIIYGRSQIYSFELLYHLQNKNVFPVKTEIAIPPTTNYQDVILESLSKKPINVVLDEDGNWLAQYYLSPLEEVDIKATGKVRTFFVPKKESLSKEEEIEYLKQVTYWERNREIEELAKKLKTPSSIYQYVVETLNYDFDRVTDNLPRLGAANTLKDPSSSVCLEFTDLFIALSRAAGIPAREINGFAYTENSKLRPLSLVKDVLHAWPQFYDKELQTWIMVDPTWGNTTGGADYFSALDFDHIAFVIKGKDSTYPIPAGGYKFKEFENSKDVHIEFAETPTQEAAGSEIAFNIPKQVLSSIPIKGQVVVKNVGNVLLPSQKINVTASNLSPKSQTLYVGKIPPYGAISVPVSFEKTPFLTNRKETIKIHTQQGDFEYSILILPLVLNYWTFIGGVLIICVSIIVPIAARFAWRIYIQKQKGKDSLRRKGD